MKRTTRLTWSVIAPLAILACAGPDVVDAPPRQGAVLATFVAEVDAATGTLTIRADHSPLATGALAELPWVQDGTPGSGPPDTVELVTEGTAGPVADGCSPGVTSYEAPVRLRSFFKKGVIKNAHVEITGMTATGFEGCGSAFPAPPPTTRDFGLFPYGMLTRAGTPGDSALATWRFRYPSATSFTMWGHVMGDLAPDAAPPTVASVSPSNAQTADTGSVAITFSEPMAVSPTAAALSLTGPGGAVAGTVDASAAGQVFTFTPAVPFVAGTYTVSVAASAADPLGSTLAAPFSSTFTIGHGPVSGTASATVQPSAVAFDRNGNGVATWSASLGSTGATTFYSTYSATTGTWSEPALLDGAGTSGARVAASATQIAVLYSATGPASLRAIIFTNGIPGAATTLATSYFGYDWGIASNGSGFAAVWAGTMYGTYSSVWNGVSWSAGSANVSGDLNASNIAVAAEGAGYRAVWLLSGHLHSASYSGSWSATVDLGFASAGIRPALATSPTLTCIAWSDSGTIRVRGEQGGSVTSQGYPSALSVTAYSAAVIGSRCQVGMATSSGGGPGTPGVYGVAFDGASWSPSLVSLGFGTSPADAVAIAPLGTTGFAAAARVVGATSDVLVNRTVGWSFSGAATQVSGAGAPARYCLAAPANGVVHLLWSQADGTADRIQKTLVDATTSKAPAILSTVRPGASSNVTLASDSSGNVLAVWQQQHLAQTWTFYSYRTGGRWSAPQPIAAGGGVPALASNGTDFMAAWTAQDTATTVKIVAQRFSGGAWIGSPATVASGTSGPRALTLASDGSGFALSYIDLSMPGYVNSPYAAIYSGTWSAPTRLSTNNLSYSVLGFAGRPGEYLLAWIESTGAYFARASYGASWTWGARTLLGATGVSSVGVAAGPGGFAVSNVTSSNTLEARIVTGGVAGAATTLRTGGSYYFSVASNGSGYLVVSGRSTGGVDIQSIAFDGSVWRTARTLRASAYIMGVAIASDGTGYSVLVDGWSYGGGLYTVAVPEPISGAFGSPVALGPGSGDGEHGAVVRSPSGFVAAWKQPDAVDSTVQRIFGAAY